MDHPSFLSPFFSPYDQKLRKKGKLIFLSVFFLHLALSALSFYRSPSHPAKKPIKIVVQTVRLSPVQPALPPPSSPMVPSLLPAQRQEESLPLLEQKIVEQKTERSAPPPAPSPVTPPVIDPPLPVVNKTEAAPKKEEKKTLLPSKTAAPLPKTAAPVKKAIEADKKEEKKKRSTVKKNLEADKKKEQEKEEKRQQEKKRQQEQIEKEKQARKRQQEKEEEEKRQHQERLKKEKIQKEVFAAQEIERQKKQALEEKLAKMRETGDKIDLSSSSLNLENTSLPKELNLQIDALFIDSQGKAVEWGAKEISYREEVAFRLKRSLKLSEYGAVKIKLTLERSGKVIKVETIDSESKKNKMSIEKDIPKILFSPFGQRFQGAADYTFLIILHNES